MSLTKSEQAVQDELRAILDAPGADSLYDKHSECMRGKILNADIARELSPHYQTVSDRIAFTPATYPPARDYVYNRFLRTIKAKPPGVAIMLAGGAASGKTTAIKGILSASDLVFDSNCADAVKARTMIDAAVSSQWRVFVIYIHRNFRVAVDAMLCRAIETGRFIPLIRPGGLDFASLHFNAQRAFVEIDSVYTDENLVRTAALRNPWTAETPLGPTTIAIKTLANGGKRYYTSIEELYEIQSEVFRAVVVSGKLPRNLARAIGIPKAVEATAGDSWQHEGESS